MFGLYLVDAFGNKELLHRDPEISSLWPVPLRARPRPPAVAVGTASLPAERRHVCGPERLSELAPAAGRDGHAAADCSSAAQDHAARQ